MVAQVSMIASAVMAEKYSSKVNRQKVMIDKRITVMKAVDLGGFFGLRSVGISANTKPICAVDMT